MPARIFTTVALLVLIAGCSSAPPQKADPVDVTVTVTLPSGQPGKDLNLMLLPTSAAQLQGGGKTDATGKVSTKLTPGKYTYAFDGDPKAVPAKYHTNNAAHEVEVKVETKTLDLKLTN